MIFFLIFLMIFDLSGADQLNTDLAPTVKQTKSVHNQPWQLAGPGTAAGNASGIFALAALLSPSYQT